MSECILYSKVGTIVSRFAASMSADSMYQQLKEAEAYRASHPESCAPPDLFIARFNAHMLQMLHNPSHKLSCLGDGLDALIEAAVEIANDSAAEIAEHATHQGLDLMEAVEYVRETARRYHRASSPPAERGAAMDCAKALEAYGRALITRYGSAADIGNTQLRILRTWILAGMTRPALPTADRIGQKERLGRLLDTIPAQPEPA